MNRYSLTFAGQSAVAELEDGFSESHVRSFWQLMAILSNFKGVDRWSGSIRAEREDYLCGGMVGWQR